MLAKERRLRRIGDEDRDDIRVTNGFSRCDRPKAVGHRAYRRRSVGSQSDDDVVTRIAKIQRVRAALAAVAEDRDALSLKREKLIFLMRSRRAHVFLVAKAVTAPVDAEETRRAY